jgi:hypothetical protein
MAYKLGVAGGSQLAIPVNPSVVGVSSAVTPTRTGTSNGTVATAGAPSDGYNVLVNVVSAGIGQLVTGGGVTVTISLDGGTTTSSPTIVPVSGTYVIAGTNLTLTFSAAVSTFDLGDKFAFTCQAPYYSASDLLAAFTVAIASPYAWTIAHVIGYPTAGSSAANATAAATMASTVDAQMTTAFNGFRYARAIMDGPPSLQADLSTAFVAFSSTRTRVGAVTCVLNSALSGRKFTRSWEWTTCARLASTTPSVSPGRVADGPMKGVVSISRNELTTPGLYDLRFGVAVQYFGVNGFFCDLGKTMATVGSDYVNIMNGRVIDVACTIGRIAGLFYLNSSIRVNATGGTILESDAVAIEDYVAAQIAAQLNPDVSAITVQTNRTDNILSTQLLRLRIRVIPVGYAANIQEDIGFFNPALSLV